jgi:hypothetical protein
MDFIFAVTALELVGRLPFTKAKLRFTKTDVTCIFFILTCAGLPHTTREVLINNIDKNVCFFVFSALGLTGELLPALAAVG